MLDPYRGQRTTLKVAIGVAGALLAVGFVAWVALWAPSSSTRPSTA